MNPHFFAAPFLLTYPYFIYRSLSRFTVLYRKLR